MLDETEFLSEYGVRSLSKYYESNPYKLNLNDTSFIVKYIPGESDSGAALSYPYAVEYQSKLYVGYSNNGRRHGNNNSAEVAVIPIAKLAVE